MLIIPPVWYPDGSPPTQPKGLNPLEGFLNVDHSPCMVPWCFFPPHLKGWIPLKAFSVLIIFPVWCPDGPPPNLKGWIPLQVFSVLIIPPVWYPDGSLPQPKGLNPLEGFLSVDHSACMVPWWFPPNLKGWIPLKVFSVLIIPPVWYPGGSPPPPT